MEKSSTLRTTNSRREPATRKPSPPASIRPMRLRLYAAVHCATNQAPPHLRANPKLEPLPRESRAAARASQGALHLSFPLSLSLLRPPRPSAPPPPVSPASASATIGRSRTLSVPRGSLINESTRCRFSLITRHNTPMRQPWRSPGLGRGPPLQFSLSLSLQADRRERGDPRPAHQRRDTWVGGVGRGRVARRGTTAPLRRSEETCHR